LFIVNNLTGDKKFEPHHYLLYNFGLTFE